MIATSSPTDPRLTVVAKIIHDLSDLVQLMLKGLARTKAWQRQLAGHLEDVDRLLQVLRMTIAMENAHDEIAGAAEAVAAACRRAGASLAGSRADSSSLQAMALIGKLGDKLRAAFASLP
ncbi:hypothetical protein [Roseateles puraquae]|nr:hypothetical protein [Roseateles puraquae]